MKAALKKFNQQKSCVLGAVALAKSDCPAGSSRGFSLIEVLVAMFIAMSCIFTFAGLLPIAIERNKSSLDLANGKNLLGTILSDLRSKPLKSDTTSLYGLRFNPSSMDEGFEDQYYFNDQGVYVGSKAASSDRFYAVKWKVSHSDFDLAGQHIRGMLSIQWPGGRNAQNAPTYKIYSLPVSLTYEE